MAQQGTAASAGRAAPAVHLSLFYQVIEKDDESFWPRGEEEEDEDTAQSESEPLRLFSLATYFIRLLLLLLQTRPPYSFWHATGKKKTKAISPLGCKTKTSSTIPIIHQDVQ